MANRAYLLTVEDAKVTWSQDPEREILAEGINEIPVFWASLFVAKDRRLDRYEGEKGELKIPNYSVKATVGKQRVQALRDRIGKLLDARSRNVWEAWVQFLADQDTKFIKTNAAEVWGLDSKGYDEYWATLLQMFASPSASTIKAAMARNDLRFVKGAVRWEDEEATICKLAGANHLRAVPWLPVTEVARSDADTTAQDSSPTCLWDLYKAFQKATGMSYEVAGMLLVVAPETTAKKSISPQKLLLGIIQYFDEQETEPADRPRELNDLGIKSPLDILRAVEGLRSAGLVISLTTYAPSDFLAAPASKQLFGDESV